MRVCVYVDQDAYVLGNRTQVLKFENLKQNFSPFISKLVLQSGWNGLIYDGTSYKSFILDQNFPRIWTFFIKMFFGLYHGGRRAQSFARI